MAKYVHQVAGRVPQFLNIKTNILLVRYLKTGQKYGEIPRIESSIIRNQILFYRRFHRRILCFAGNCTDKIKVHD